jgi:hypothetical protein
MTITNIAIAVLTFFGCEALLLIALWKGSRHRAAAQKPPSARPRLLAK